MARNSKMAQPWYCKVNINNIYAGFTALFLLAAFVFLLRFLWSSSLLTFLYRYATLKPRLVSELYQNG